jgi:hypothetical protein
MLGIRYWHEIFYFIFISFNKNGMAFASTASMATNKDLSQRLDATKGLTSNFDRPVTEQPAGASHRSGSLVHRAPATQHDGPHHDYMI